MNKEKAAAAKALFMEGYNCSQAVVGAWAEDIGLDSETAYKSFGLWRRNRQNERGLRSIYRCSHGAWIEIWQHHRQ